MSTAPLTAPAAAPAPAPPARAAIYAQALRAYSFPASVVSVLLGTALAWRGYALPSGVAGHFSLLAFTLTLAGALLAHAAGNVLNDYYDYVKGVDTLPEHGSGVLPAKLLTPSEMFRFGALLLAGAAVCGAALLLLAPAARGVIVPLALLGAVCAVFYPLALKRYALGDMVIILSFGVGLTLGAYGVQTPIWSVSQTVFVALASLPVALLTDAILHANNIRDAKTDVLSGVRTIASLLGPAGASRLQAVLLFAPAALVVAATLLRVLPWSSLAVLLSVPLLVKAYKTGDVPFVAQSNLVFGVLLALSVAVLPRP